MPLKTPSGMSIADAEALSRKQQAAIKASMPKGGSFFTVGGSRQPQLGYRKDNTVYWIDDKNFARQDQSQNYGSWQSSLYGHLMSKLGIESAPMVNNADLQHQIQRTKTLATSNIDIADAIKEFQSSQPTPNLATMTGEEYLAAGYSGGQPPATPISPVAPEAIAPENSIAGIQSVFGANWQPSPAFTPALQAKGIFGAVRIKGTNEVYTLGPGGTKETADSFLQKFGTSDQTGIVGEISKDQATRLGITDTNQTPVSGITPEGLNSENQIAIPSGETGTSSAADTIIAGAEEYLKLQESLKTEKEKETEKEIDDLTSLLEESYSEEDGPGADQIAEEEKRKIEEQQKAVDDANGNLQIKLAEINALTASYNLENQIVEGKAITLGRQQGQQAQNYKMYLAQKNLMTSQASLLQATALGLQGKLDSAQAAADRAVDLKWKDREIRQANQIALLNLLKDRLTEQQQPRVDALANYYAQQNEAIADQKATEKANYTTLLSQANQYPDANIQLTDTLEQANAKIVANSKIYQQQTRLANQPGPPGPPGPDEPPIPEEEPLSINQIEQFRRSYGWTPPLGFTNDQLIQYMNDNPDATPEELEAGARQTQGDDTTIPPTEPQTNFPDTVGHIMNTISDDERNALFAKAKTAGVTKLFRGKRNDVQAYIETFKTQIEEAINSGYSKDEIKAFILGL